MDPERVAPERTSDAQRETPAPVQAALLVGAVDDPLEHEADRVARRIVDSLRRDQHGDAPDPQAVVTDATGGRIRRAAAIGATGGAVDDHFESRIRAARGAGSALPDGIGDRMQRAFDTDFSQVRLHSDARSQELNRQISARAFTTGNDIFLGRSAPSLSSNDGQELLAHELTHVVQQSGGAQRSVIRRDYVKGTADADATLFDKEAPVDRPLDVSPTSRAAAFGITAGNMPHYLERHTFKYQRLNAKTVSPGAGFFPHGTTADDVADMLDEALQKLPDGTAIGDTPVSVAVDLSNGLRVNVGALKGGKLSAFFPIEGGSNAGFHAYTSDELKAIRTAKNAPATTPSGGGPTS